MPNAGSSTNRRRWKNASPTAAPLPQGHGDAAGAPIFVGVASPLRVATGGHANWRFEVRGRRWPAHENRRRGGALGGPRSPRRERAPLAQPPALLSSGLTAQGNRGQLRQVPHYWTAARRTFRPAFTGPKSSTIERCISNSIYRALAAYWVSSNSKKERTKAMDC